MPSEEKATRDYEPREARTSLVEQVGELQMQVAELQKRLADADYRISAQSEQLDWLEVEVGK